MTGEDGPGQVVKPAVTAPAEKTLPGRLGLIVALLGNLAGVAVRATDPLRPPQIADHLEAARVVDQSLNIEHPWDKPILAPSRKKGKSDMPIVFNCTARSPQVQ